MNNWNQFLSSTPSRPAHVEALSGGFMAPVSQWGLISVTGDDAASFLHNQLTNDVEHLDGQALRLAAYCSPKGRMLASFLMWRDETAIRLCLSADILPAVHKRLSMFVLRAKAKLLVDQEHLVLGLGGAAAEAALLALVGSLPAAFQHHATPYGQLVRVADAFGAARYLIVVPSAQVDALLTALSGKLPLFTEDAWHLAQIHAGFATIEQKTQEQFVPQMLNFELIGGVNFKKGCYPGQEIVARSQYLGKLKRRTMLARVPAAAVAGTEVFAEDDPGQPCGMVVNAASNGLGGSDLLVELKLAAAGATAIHLGQPDGPLLSLLPMPYALDALDL